MGTRTRWILVAGTFAVSAIIVGSAIAQAIRQHSLDPVWMVGWLPAVLAGVYPALTRRGGRRTVAACPGCGARQAPEQPEQPEEAVSNRRREGQVLAMPVLIGTSGWQYRDWRGVLYPPGLAERDWLEYYAGRYGTVENNGTFYRLPAADTFAAWRAKVPEGFVMTVKASRYLTHVRRLREPAEPVRRLLRAAAGLGDRLGPVLLQLPPNLRADAGALDTCLGEFARFPGSGASGGRVRVAVEFRHESWWIDETRQLLASHNAALCWVDRLGRPQAPLWRTADWGYLRFMRARRSLGRGTAPRPCAAGSSGPGRPGRTARTSSCTSTTISMPPRCMTPAAFAKIARHAGRQVTLAPEPGT